MCTMGRSALILVALVAAICPACLGGSAAAPVPPALGTVSGRVVMIGSGGGLPSGVSGSDTGGGLRVRVLEVVVRGRTSSGERLERHVWTDSRLRFRLRLPAGRYTVATSIRGAERATVRVRRGRTDRVLLTVYMAVTLTPAGV